MQNIVNISRKKNNTQILYSVQILRFFAALLVVTMHATEAVILRANAPESFFWNHGSVGVDIFFVISGFVMTLLSPRPRESFSENINTAVDFIKKRLLRIVPMYWFFTILKLILVTLLPAMALRTIISSDHILLSFVFWPAVNSVGLIQPFLPVGWTLNFEMFFYFVFSLAIMFSISKFWFCLTVFLVIYLASIIFPDSTALLFFAQSISYDFLLGILIGSFIIADIKVNSVVSLLLFSVATIILFLPTHYSPVERFFYRSVMAALAVFGFVLLEHKIRKVRWLRELTIFGDASYSIYLAHTFVVPSTVFLLNRFGVGTYSVLCMFAIILAILGGYTSYQYLERPFTKFLKQRYFSAVAQ